MHTIKDLRTTLRSLSIYTPANKKFNRSQHRDPIHSSSPAFIDWPNHLRDRDTKKCLQFQAFSTPLNFDGVVKGPEHPHLGNLQLHHTTHLPPFGDSLFHFWAAWEQSTSNKWVLKIITSSYSIHFTSIPSSHSCPYPFSGTLLTNICWDRRLPLF